MVLPIHIAAGAVAIVLGGTALLARKGGPVHRRVGLLFVFAMLVMTTTAAIIALRKSLLDPNLFAAVLTTYLVVTALTTVRPVGAWTRRMTAAGLVVAGVLAVFYLRAGVIAANSPRGSLGGVPFPMFFFLAAVMTLSAIGDVRMLRGGVPKGRARLARHLWRMCFALFIAAGSFFSIRARVATILPEALTAAPLRMLPIVLPFVAMFYWLWKVRARRALSVTVRHDPTPLSQIE